MEAKDPIDRNKSFSHAAESTAESRMFINPNLSKTERSPTSKIDFLRVLSWRNQEEAEDRDIIPRDPSKVHAPDLLNPFGHENDDFLNLKLHCKTSRPIDKIVSI